MNKAEGPPDTSGLAEAMVEIVSQALDIDQDEVSMNARLAADLDADSLDIVDIGYRVSKRFGVELPLLDLRKRFDESDIAWLNEDGVVTEDGLAQAEAELPEIRGKIHAGDAVEAIFTVLTVEDLITMLDRRLRQQ